MEHAFQPHADGDVVRGRAGLELVDEPQSLLGEGERQRLRARNGRERRRLGQLGQPALEQRPVDLAGALVQLAPGERLAVMLRGHRVGRETRLRLDEPVQAAVSHRGGVRLPPGVEQEVPFVFREEGHAGERAVRIRQRRLQQHAQVFNHPRCRRGIEQVGAVLELTLDALAPVGEGQGEVELRRAMLRREGVQLQPRAHHLRHGRVLEREHHLEERRASGLALGAQRLHQLLEGHVLVGVGTERHVPHAAEQRAEAGVSVQLRAQHQRVDEEADEPFQLRMRPAGDGHADADVVLPGVAGQQRLEGGEHHHGGRGSLLTAQCFERIRQLVREVERMPGAASRLRRGTRPVGGQGEGAGRAVELLPPPAQLGLQGLVAQPVALPEREVGVLHRQRLQARGAALGMGRVERGQLLDEHAHGPAVRDDVVQGEQQHVLLRRLAHQEDAPERPRLQVEGLPGLVFEGALERVLTLGFGQGLQVHPARGQGGAGVDDLDGLVLVLVEGGAQGLVALEQLAQAGGERGHVELAVHPHGEGEVVGGALGVELREEPQALLCEGQRQRPAVLPGTEQRLGGGGPRARLRLDALCQRRDGGRGEEVAERQLHAEVLADAREHLRGRQGVATQIEEVVLRANGVQVEDAGPERRQLALAVGARRTGGDAVLEGRRGRECLAVHLAVGGERQRVQAAQGGGHHVLGEPLLEGLAQSVQVQRRGRDDVGDQALVAGRVLAGHHDGLAHLGDGEQGGFDLGQLDAVAAHLHLRVGAAEELQHAVLPPAAQVTRAVQACAGHRREGVGDEALGGEGGLADVATGETVTTGEQLTDDARGHGLTGGVQHVHLGVADGPADGDGGAHVGHVRHAVAGGEEGALGGAVAGRHRNEHSFQHPADVGGAHHVTAGEQLPHVAQRGEVAVHHLGEEAGGEVQRRHAVLLQHLLQLEDVRGRVGREDGQPRAMQQRAPELQRGGIEGDGGEQEEGFLRPEARVVVAEDGAQHGGLARAHALGPAGGTGGEVDVREAVGQGGGRRRVRGQAGQLHVLQHHRGEPLGRQLRQQRARGDEHARARVLQHGHEALAGVRRVQRHVRAAGLEDGDEGDNQFQRAVHAQRHARVGGHTQAAQMPRELVGARVELPVGELRVAELDGDLVGEAGHHLSEDLGQGGATRVLGGGGVPLHQHPLAHLGRQRGPGGVALHGAGLRLLARGDFFQGKDRQ